MSALPTPPTLVHFGVFEADLSAGELRRNGVKVRLQDLPFRALTLLLSRPGEVITREEFRRALWPPDVFVDFEQGISSAMMRLRDALRDSSENPIFIETIERRGYRWIGPVQTPEPVSQPDRPAVSPEIAREGSEKQVTIAGGTHPASRNLSRALIFMAPLLVLLFAVGLLRFGNRNVKPIGKPILAAPRSAHQPANREAEDFYLKGRFYWNKRTPESLNQAVEAFTQAISRDPNYSEAYVGLSDSYNLLREFAAMPANEAYFKAFAAAKKAVELDPDSADAQVSLAFVTFWGMWDAADAEKGFRRSIELDPNNVKAHHWFATFLQALGRNDEALNEIDRARELDPHSSSILADKGRLLWVAGRRQEGLQVLKQMESAEPDFASPHRYLRFAYFETGDAPNYLVEFKAEARLIHDSAELSEEEAAARGFAEGGERGMLRAELAEQMTLYQQGKLSPFYVAESEARLGNKQEALKYLSACVQSHDALTLNISQAESFAILRNNPDFEQLMAVVGVPANR